MFNGLYKDIIPQAVYSILTTTLSPSVCVQSATVHPPSLSPPPHQIQQQRDITKTTCAAAGEADRFESVAIRGKHAAKVLEFAMDLAFRRTLGLVNSENEPYTGATQAAPFSRDKAGWLEHTIVYLLPDTPYVGPEP